MAIFTRTAGDAKGVVHVDTSRADVVGGGIGTIISTGIGKRPTMFLVDTGTVDLRGEMGVGGAVETMLRTVALKATIIAYQVQNDNSGEMRVLVEATGWADDAELQAAIRALGSVGAGPANLGAATVSSAGGLKA